MHALLQFYNCFAGGKRSAIHVGHCQVKVCVQTVQLHDNFMYARVHTQFALNNNYHSSSNKVVSVSKTTTRQPESWLVVEVNTSGVLKLYV